MKDESVRINTVRNYAAPLLPLLTACFFAAPALAQLHESLEECTSKLGTPTTEGSGAKMDEPNLEHVAVFKKGAHTIFIGFVEGKAVMVEYARQDKAALSEEKVAGFLDLNAEGSKFTKKPEHNQKAEEMTGTLWERKDGKAIALLKENGETKESRLEIWDNDYFEKRFTKSEKKTP